MAYRVNLWLQETNNLSRYAAMSMNNLVKLPGRDTIIDPLMKLPRTDPEAIGLSSNPVSRLKQVWAQEYRSGCNESLAGSMWGER